MDISPMACVHPHERKTGAPARGVGPWMLGSSDTVWERRSPGDGYNLEHMNTCCQGMNACQAGGLLSHSSFCWLPSPSGACRAEKLSRQQGAPLTSA